MNLPAYVARAIQDLSAGKRPNERVFSVTQFNVNAYLRNNLEFAFTAKDFRTIGASRYLKCFMENLESVRLKQSLTSGDLKQIFRGISSNRRGQSAQKLVGVARTVTAEVVRQLKPAVEIPTYFRSSKSHGSRTNKAEGRVGALPFVAFLLNSSERLVRTCHFDTRRFLPYCFSWGWDERTSFEREFYTADGQDR